MVEQRVEVSNQLLVVLQLLVSLVCFLVAFDFLFVAIELFLHLLVDSFERSYPLVILRH